MVTKQELVNRSIQMSELENALEAFFVADQGSHIVQLTQREHAERKRSRMSEVQKILAVGEDIEEKPGERAETVVHSFALKKATLSEVKEKPLEMQFARE